MSYLLTNVKETDGVNRDFYIKEGKISYTGMELSRLKAMRMNGAGFTITPGRVAVDFSLMKINDFSLYKKRMIAHQRQGCSTILTVYPLTPGEPFKRQLKKARHHMINSSIDYVIGVSLPLRELTPTFVRACKREKIPFIFTDVDTLTDFDRIPWSRIRDAMFPYRPVIVPNWFNIDLHAARTLWRTICDEHDIPTLFSIPHDREILTMKMRKKIGISPLKGELRTGGTADYNLYQTACIAGADHVHYDKKYIPDVVVLNKKVMKAGPHIYYRPGFGREIVIRVPGYFAFYE